MNLVYHQEQYGGKYVATKSLKSKTVIASGKDPLKVIASAEKKGAKEPFVFYVPKKNETWIL